MRSLWLWDGAFERIESKPARFGMESCQGTLGRLCCEVDVLYPILRSAFRLFGGMVRSHLTHRPKGLRVVPLVRFCFRMEDMMSHAYLVEDPKMNRLYCRFPELVDVFRGISEDRSDIYDEVLTACDEDGFQYVMEDCILPWMVSLGIVEPDLKKRCGYSTRYNHLIFPSEPRSGVANVTLRIGEGIAGAFKDDDPKSASLAFASSLKLPAAKAQEFIVELRSLAEKLVAQEPSQDGKIFRVAFLGRIF